jgi:hypothetical protein
MSAKRQNLDTLEPFPPTAEGAQLWMPPPPSARTRGAVMRETLTIDHYRARIEFRWLAFVGMNAFLVSAAVGSPAIMSAGLMMWVGFGLLGRRFSASRTSARGALKARGRPDHERPVPGPVFISSEKRK